MNRSTLLLIAFAFWLFAFGYQIGSLYPQLPDRVASHFNAHGEPDGWSDKGSFLMVYVVTIAPTAILFPVCWLLLPLTPPSWINMPRKDYWLAPERRADTIEAVRTFLLAIGHGTVALLFALMQSTLKANLQPAPHLGAGVGWLLGIYFGLLLLMTGWFLLRFRR